ncbi:MAG: glycerol-3-phosphate acyltransferase, partial [Liquorilactobacillus hordei]
MDSTIVLMLVIGYLLGSIPSGIWIGKIFYNKDIR